jgi:PIN domain nuclease of toxin-antitoxin system
MNEDLLLDTSFLVWIVSGDKRSAWVENVAEDNSSTLHMSSVVLTEIAIKHALGTLPVTVRAVRAAALALEMVELPFIGSHAERLARLPSHHRDPFDRMLVAQAQAEELQLVTADRLLAPYDRVTLREL